MAPFLLSGDAMGLLWEKSLRVVFFATASSCGMGGSAPYAMSAACPMQCRQRAFRNVGSVPFAMSAARPLQCRQRALCIVGDGLSDKLRSAWQAGGKFWAADAQRKKKRGGEDHDRRNYERHNR